MSRRLRGASLGFAVGAAPDEDNLTGDKGSDTLVDSVNDELLSVGGFAGGKMHARLLSLASSSLEILRF